MPAANAACVACAGFAASEPLALQVHHLLSTSVLACRATIAELRGMAWVQQGYNPARALSLRISGDSDGSDDHMFDDTVEPQYLDEVRQ